MLIKKDILLPHNNFEGTNPNNPDLLDLSDLPHPTLERLIQHILMDSYLWITVQEGEESKSYPIYLLHLYREKSYWLMEGFHLEEEKTQIIPVDHLTDVRSYPVPKRVSRKKILERQRSQKQDVNLVLDLGPKAIAQFKKYHPLTVSISYINPYQTRARLNSFVDVWNEEEVVEMVNWMLFLGEDVEVKEISEMVLEEIRCRVKYL